MGWEIVTLWNQKYKVMNPNNWEELSYGLHNDCLGPSEVTRIKKEKEKKAEPSSLLDLFV